MTLFGCAADRTVQGPPARAVSVTPVVEPPQQAACTTTLEMKPDRVVLRSGGCPDGADAATLRSHVADVEAAVRQLQPGEQTTVSTVAHFTAPQR
jgi:hypothetical protein